MIVRFRVDGDYQSFTNVNFAYSHAQALANRDKVPKHVLSNGVKIGTVTPVANSDDHELTDLDDIIRSLP